MTRRYELTDEQYALFQDLLPGNGKPSGQWNDHKTTLDGIFCILHTGSQWRELPERYGKWKSVHDRLTRWRKDARPAHIKLLKLREFCNCRHGNSACYEADGATFAWKHG